MDYKLYELKLEADDTSVVKVMVPEDEAGLKKLIQFMQGKRFEFVSSRLIKDFNVVKTSI